MEELIKLKEDIIERYEGWVDDSPKDGMGLKEYIKQDFRQLVENLLSGAYKLGAKENE